MNYFRQMMNLHGKFKYFFLCLFFAGSHSIAFSQDIPAIIPRPVEINMEAGHFIINENTRLSCDAKDDLTNEFRLFTQSIQRISGYRLTGNSSVGNYIHIQLDSLKMPNRDGYLMQVKTDSIIITANNKNGVGHAFQTLLQTLPAIRTNARLMVPAMQITDYPHFGYRGMHLDVSRHFFGMETVRRYLDNLARYKLNIFHWHLTDDPGWRLEIKNYPLLTEVGAWRVNRNDQLWHDRAAATANEPATYGGYFTQEQASEIVDYAAARGITVIPEIEMPGHAAAAVASYPHLQCFPKTQQVITGGQYPRDHQTSFCAGNDSTFIFLEDVLEETMAIFPSEYIHIGGDELDKEPWRKCPKCQKRMQDEGLANVDELQSYFIRRIEKFVNAHGRKIIGWDEILEGGLAPQATVMSWRGEKGGIAAAKMGHDVIMTPGAPLYFDHYQAGPEGEPASIGGFNSLKNVYDYYPVPDELSAAEGKHILGAQANIWAEYIQTPDHLEYMQLPRVAALAEMLWLPREEKDFNNFYARLQSHFRIYEQLGYRYSKGNFTPLIKPVIEDGKLLIDLSSEIPGVDIRYTTDGSTPNDSSALYFAPVPVSKSMTIKAATFQGSVNQTAAPAEQSFAMHNAIGSYVYYDNAYSADYAADGPATLVDGIRGSERVNKYWLGFSGENMVATIDLGRTRNIREIAAGFLQKYVDWIFLPTHVEFETSNDGKSFARAGQANNPVSPNVQDPLQHDFTLKLPASRQARYIRVTAHTLPGAPKNHPGEGKPVWIFADEIMVN